MQLLKLVFSHPLTGSIIGIVGLLIGYVLYRASRIGPRPAYQSRALRLIGKEERALPEDVEILFRGRSVPRLTKAYIVFWNSGKATLDKEHVVADDPVRLTFSQGSEILRVRVPKVTRKQNKFKADANPHSPNEVICSFDFLDPGDGALVELLHTDKKRFPRVQGTLRGIRKGPLNLGRILPPYSVTPLPSFFGRRIGMALLVLIGGFCMIIAGLVGLAQLPKESKLFLADRGTALLFLIFGLIYFSSSSFVLWRMKRKFPKPLLIEDLQE